MSHLDCRTEQALDALFNTFIQHIARLGIEALSQSITPEVPHQMDRVTIIQQLMFMLDRGEITSSQYVRISSILLDVNTTVTVDCHGEVQLTNSKGLNFPLNNLLLN